MTFKCWGSTAVVLLIFNRHSPNAPSPLYKGGGWDFSKMALMGWKVVSLHSWQKRANPSIYDPPLPPPPSYIVYTPFSNFVHPTNFVHKHTSLSSPTPTPTVLSAALFFWLNGWSCLMLCVILLMIIWIDTCRALVPEGPWYVFYATRHQVYCGLTHKVFFPLVLWFDITHTNTQTLIAHLGAIRLTRSYKYIFALPVICSQQLPVLND